ncbi:tether containing UBX domain for GLUT4, partial [Lecanoromycetidae sp. Uapishka_2]
MASHVVVLDSSARRAVIKTAPNKHLSDVLQEACEKFKIDPSRHGLKNSAGKTLDLSQPLRLTGLSSGAKLQLLVLSRSPSAVNVALQIPDSETNGGPNRLTDKLASTTTLWILLRHFETVSKINLTARGVPQVEGDQESGTGRLYHEAPVVNVMGRELVSFTDLQKTLSQLGLHSGSVLLRLSFRPTETPLEEALVQIDQYFKSMEGETHDGVHASSVGNAECAPESSNVVDTEEIETASPLGSGSPANEVPDGAYPKPDKEMNGGVPLEPDLMSNVAPSPPPEQTVTGPSQRPMTILAPPSTTVPAAARQPYHEKDYEPTIDHAKRHQSRLADFGRNKPLPSDAEIAAQAEAQQKKAADIKEVKIKVRFPDQSQVVSTFSNVDTAASLYDFVKGLMACENEPFSLNFSSAKGPKVVPKGGDNPKLISGLGMMGAVLVNVVWEEGASSEARGGKVLKEEYQEKATPIEVKEPDALEIDEKERDVTQSQAKTGPEGKGKSGVPKWFKMGGKK